MTRAAAPVSRPRSVPGVRLHRRQESLFVIGDLHFDHEAVIKGCDRPFGSVDERNEALIEYWNDVVGIDDTVYVLGDFTFGASPRRVQELADLLNGVKVFIPGTHDERSKRWFVDYATLTYRHKDFVLIHDPHDAPKTDAWIVHGHSHNKNPDYPFINPARKTVNASAELINYTPLRLDTLVKYLKDGRRYEILPEKRI